MERELPIRITIFRTLEGVKLAVQHGKGELLPPLKKDGDTVSFDFTVRAAERKEGGDPNVLGPYTFGTPSDRFFYVGAGTGAGQRGTPWSRRAKIKTKGITWKLVEQTLAMPGAVLEAQIDGRAKDGGPSCATVPLLDGGPSCATVPLLDGGWKVRSN